MKTSEKVQKRTARDWLGGYEMRLLIMLYGSAIALYFLAAIWIIAHDNYHGVNDLYMSLFAALVGALCVGLVVYAWSVEGCQ